jgi:hypothetical protein
VAPPPHSRTLTWHGTLNLKNKLSRNSVGDPRRACAEHVRRPSCGRRLLPTTTRHRPVRGDAISPLWGRGGRRAWFGGGETAIINDPTPENLNVNLNARAWAAFAEVVARYGWHRASGPRSTGRAPHAKSAPRDSNCCGHELADRRNRSRAPGVGAHARWRSAEWRGRGHRPGPVDTPRAADGVLPASDG